MVDATPPVIELAAIAGAPNEEVKETAVLDESFTGFPWASFTTALRVVEPPWGRMVWVAVRLIENPLPDPKPLEEEVLEEQPAIAKAQSIKPKRKIFL